MDRRWIGGVVAVAIVAIAVFFLFRRKPEPGVTHDEGTATEDAGDNNVAVDDQSSPPPVEPTTAPPTSADAAAPPRPRTAFQPFRTPERPNDPSAPGATGLAQLAQQLCTFARANDRAGVASVMGPGFTDIPMDQLRTECTDEVIHASADNEPYGTAESMFGPRFERWATRSGLDRNHCIGMRLALGRVMACRNAAGEYKIAAVDFNAPDPYVEALPDAAPAMMVQGGPPVIDAYSPDGG